MEITMISGKKEYYCDVTGVEVRHGCLSFNFGDGYVRKRLCYPLTSILKWEDP